MVLNVSLYIGGGGSSFRKLDKGEGHILEGRIGERVTFYGSTVLRIPPAHPPPCNYWRLPYSMLQHSLLHAWYIKLHTLHRESDKVEAIRCHFYQEQDNASSSDSSSDSASDRQSSDSDIVEDEFGSSDDNKPYLPAVYTRSGRRATTWKTRGDLKIYTSIGRMGFESFF